MIFVKPLDEKLLHKVFQKFENIVTIEDGCIQGGFGSAVIEFMSDNNYKANVVRVGIPDKFIIMELRRNYIKNVCMMLKPYKKLLLN